MKLLRSLSMATMVALLLAGGSLEAISGQGCSTQSASLDQAFQQAKSHSLPVLIKVGAEWCSACKAFDAATADGSTLVSSIGTQAVLYRVDGEKGEGKDIAKRYRVMGYPTFLLVNAEGEVLDRWMGFKEAADFTSTFETATKDPVTIQERIHRFQSEPTASAAEKIADLRQAEGLFAEACAYYHRASDLDGSPDSHYQAAIFGSMAMGSKTGAYSPKDVRAQADVLLSSPQVASKDYLKVAYTMGRMASITGDANDFNPYLKLAVERTAQETDAEMVDLRSKLLPDYALRIEKNAERAVSYKRASMPKDWKDDANQLNNFAWWCFENKVNLDEAKVLAEKGVELAKPGIEKANVLDTLAEICNQTGKCGDSVELIQLAIKEAPDNEYFKKQLTRFETLMASQTK